MNAYLANLGASGAPLTDLMPPSNLTSFFWLAIALVLLVGILWLNKHSIRKPVEPIFLVEPYLQLGADGGTTNNMELRFMTSGRDYEWHVIIEPRSLYPKEQFKRRKLKPSVSLLKINGSPLIDLDRPQRHISMAVTLDNLLPGRFYKYTVIRGRRKVFSAEFQSRKIAGQSFRLAVVGDPGTKGDGQAKVANRVGMVEPDLIIFPGDIVYKHGLFSEYLRNFFPFQAKLLSRFLSVEVVGNHDVTRPDFRKAHSLTEFPESLAWYYVWSLPLNGPRYPSLYHNVERLQGSKYLRRTFRHNAGARYPGMGNFSFNYGDVHFVVLDANTYMDWTNKQFRQWLKDDLANSPAIWKIVIWHQPAFTSHLRHRVEQRMRLVTDIIQDAGVHLVLTGHAHHYERSYPITFTVKPRSDGRLIGPDGLVDGEIELDKDFDGVLVTKPRGVVYVVSGGGGAPLSKVDRDVSDKSSEWESFTHKVVFDKHSFSDIEVDEYKVTLRQTAADGEVFDKFTITQ